MPTRRGAKSYVRTLAGLLGMGIMLAGLTACPLEKKPPTTQIANLVYGLLRVPVQEGRSTTLTGTFNIIHKTAETDSVSTVVYDAQGKQVAVETIPLGDSSLRTSDTLAFGVDTSIAKKGLYTFQVYVTDSKGGQSNRLAGTFAVTDVF